MKVLIADDSQIMRKIIRLNLQKLGVDKIFECSDGANACKTLAANPDISVLFTDLNMPNLNGLELVQYVKTLPKLRDMTIIVISEYLGGNAEQSFKALGVKCFVPKPFDIGRFNEVVTPIVNTVQASSVKQTKMDKKDYEGLLVAEHPSVDITKEKLEIVFTNCSIVVDTENLLSVAEYKPNLTGNLPTLDAV